MSDMERGQSETSADSLSAAYERRTSQLYETRGALAEAVATLTVEARAVREDIQRLRKENDWLRADNQVLRDNAQQSLEHTAAVEAEAQSIDSGRDRARKPEGRPLDGASSSRRLPTSPPARMSLDSARPGDPEISVVIVTYGAWTLTERAIASLRAHTGRAYELIIVDNASEDETREQLSKLHDAHVILNDDNRGFGPATNQGAERARGKLLLLLNTDTFVQAGWLEPLLETIGQPGIGAVIPRYLHPDGSLQDAGTLLARDGTVHVHGDGDDAGRLCYRFRRVIDFGSAACLLIRRSTFELLGGFDANFAPAYYEDADLAMRLRQLGLSVVYEPRSTVTHLRYGSGGSDRAIEAERAAPAPVRRAVGRSARWQTVDVSRVE